MFDEKLSDQCVPFLRSKIERNTAVVVPFVGISTPLRRMRSIRTKNHIWVEADLIDEIFEAVEMVAGSCEVKWRASVSSTHLRSNEDYVIPKQKREKTSHQSRGFDTNVKCRQKKTAQKRKEFIL